jgi:UrcA family protein
MRTIRLTAALLTLAAPSSAFAETIIVEGGVPTIRVIYADLDLGMPSGVHKLQSRARHAAGTLCFGNGYTDLARAFDEQRCYVAAVSSAQRQITAAVHASGSTSDTTIAVAAR